jgi:hypothetical protein
MPLLGAIPVILDLLCVIHVYRSGRPYWWYLVIVGFPVFGAVAYLLFEVLPSSGGSRVAKRVIKSIDPSADLKARIREVERCGSIANRAALADELISTGQFDDAVGLYKSCLVGQHEQDVALMFGLAEAYFHGRDADNALVWLDKVIAVEPWFQSGSAKLFRARALAGAGRDEEALTQYEAILDHYPGEEARCRYAALLARLGRLDAAERALTEAEKRCALNGRLYARDNREWISGARDDVETARRAVA